MQYRFLFWLRFIHCTIVSLLILYCFSFSLNCKQKDEKSPKEVSMNCNGLCLLHHTMAKCTYTWLHHLLKLLTSSNISTMYQFKSAGWFHVETYYRCFLGLWFAKTAAAKIVIKRVWWYPLYIHTYISKSFSPSMIHLTNYQMCNIVCLKKYRIW